MMLPIGVYAEPDEAAAGAGPGLSCIARYYCAMDNINFYNMNYNVQHELQSKIVQHQASIADRKR